MKKESILQRLHTGGCQGFCKKNTTCCGKTKNCFLIISRKKCGDCFCKIHLDLDNPPGGSLNLLFFFYFEALLLKEYILIGNIINFF
jgi:hypothetical protein